MEREERQGCVLFKVDPGKECSKSQLKAEAGVEFPEEARADKLLQHGMPLLWDRGLPPGGM